ncbi:uncharacterized protein TrAFT101_010214 [Trichoderma asperellum]|uniref:uncharacterized protein n=1 Tax=Trichoderma asperellum TaxID=101201 RepID=UPI00332F3AAD|nr:hypothetical protein TrAFT101_010214 [Trichoderma asperellum]
MRSQSLKFLLPKQCNGTRSVDYWISSMKTRPSATHLRTMAELIAAICRKLHRLAASSVLPQIRRSETGSPEGEEPSPTRQDFKNLPFSQ